MRKLYLLLPLAIGFLTISLLAQQAAPAIQGEYLETRSADVYTGQCFANSEMNLTGDEAILAWHIREGKWDGVALNGLTVGAAVKAHATLGDPYGKPYPAKAVLFVDKNATPVQRQALINFAQQMGGELLRHVVRVMDVPVNMQVLSQHSVRAELQAGEFITVKTRAIGPNDHLCGNEDTFYPPLTRTTHAMPAVAITNSYSGKDLNDTWELHDKRSAFVGAFATNQLLAASR
ncbi:MAG: DUF1326 domain-containing protein [Actinomycetota bacterium]